MQNLSLKLFLCAAFFATLLPGICQAEENKPKSNHQATFAPRNDLDYNLTGEFVGPISLAENKNQTMALQVRYIGGQNFEGMQYIGGLPGEKSHKSSAARLIGRRGGQFVVLSGGQWAVFVEQDHCLVVNRQGQQVGRLARVHRTSPTMGATAPKNAVVLFDGSNTDQFINGQISPDGYLMEGADWKPMFQDFNLHLEFKLPYVPTQFDQARGNSGVYLQSRYEVQILDSFANKAVFNGCGSLYRTQVPSVNMSFPPLQWQTYDIIFTAPRWAADGTKIRNARITVWHNGVKIHHNLELKNKTGAGKQEEPLLLPTRFQDHGNPVRYRNVWVIDRGLTSNVRFPVYPSAKATQQPKAQPKKKPIPKKVAGKPQAQKDPKQQATPKTELKKSEAKQPQLKRPDPKKPKPKKPQPKKNPTKERAKQPAKQPTSISNEK